MGRGASALSPGHSHRRTTQSGRARKHTRAAHERTYAKRQRRKVAHTNPPNKTPGQVRTIQPSRPQPPGTFGVLTSGDSNQRPPAVTSRTRETASRPAPRGLPEGRPRTAQRTQRGRGDRTRTVTPGAGPGNERGSPRIAPSRGAEVRDVTSTNSNAPPRVGGGGGAGGPGNEREMPEVTPTWGTDGRDVSIPNSNAPSRAGCVGGRVVKPGTRN